MEQYNSSSDDDGDFDGILKQALDVQITADFNPNLMPRDGNEFLQYVIYERRNCKKVVISDIKPEAYAKNQTISFNLENPVTKSSLVPTKEWQLMKLADFQDFHCYVAEFIDNENESITVFDTDSFLKTILTDPPILSYLSKLAQCAKIKMLELLTNTLSNLNPGTSLNDNVGMWIFAILSFLQIPLSPSNCYIIREFAKKCLQIRSNLLMPEQENCVSTLNFFICIVGRFFCQLDLADI